VHGLFGINILSAEQQHVADRFAGRGGVKGEARYEGAEWIVTERGLSLLVGALANAEFQVEEIIERHSHAIVIGEPLAISATSDSDALIYWRSAYLAVGSGVRLAAE
jgi:flavin reductase (DIM6/NTAB) family NADH-FMN oxidoreductase RutF